ncbi:hypothetical protein EDD86DRAFT_250607 [Gorgonomyces haynaldii]|nr:hypothetical protein EDD86DRAFT_250607 [Gorgonomyces haynaldii]
MTADKKVRVFKSEKDICLHAIKGSLRSFFISFLLKGGITSAIRLIKLLKGKMSLSQLIIGFFEKETFRFASMVGLYSFLWKLCNYLLNFYRGNTKPSKLNGAIAGGVAGLSVLVEDKTTRVAIAQQFSMRALQAGYNALEARKLYSFPHGDAILFGLACGSILYAYVMHPNTIPREYYTWMAKTSDVPIPMLEAYRDNLNRWMEDNKEANLPLWEQSFDKIHAHPQAMEIMTKYTNAHNGQMPMAPCVLSHPHSIACVPYWFTAFYKAASSMVPVYLSVNTIPLLLFKPQVFRQPIPTIKRILISTLTSSSFIGTLIIVFQSLFCITRMVEPNARDNRFLYYIYGVIAGTSSIFLEQESRRQELAMFVQKR